MPPVEAGKLRRTKAHTQKTSSLAHKQVKLCACKARKYKKGVGAAAKQAAARGHRKPPIPSKRSVRAHKAKRQGDVSENGTVVSVRFVCVQVLGGGCARTLVVRSRCVCVCVLTMHERERERVCVWAASARVWCADVSARAQPHTTARRPPLLVVVCMAAGGEQ